MQLEGEALHDSDSDEDNVVDSDEDNAVDSDDDNESDSDDDGALTPSNTNADELFVK